METQVPTSHHADHSRFPKIIIRDMIGREIDTDTSYQRAITEARYKMSTGEGPSVAEEWRLPHARLPARPDYTRTAPPLAMQRVYKKELRKQNKVFNSMPDLPEGIESEKEYDALRWSLQQMETLPALEGARLLREAERSAVRTYMPFVGTAPVVNKHMTEVDKREPVYEPPSQCYGCTRGTGLCYGCDRDPNPHFHRDKPFRTGGGFVYMKRDIVQAPILSKNPANWKVGLPPIRLDRERLPPTSYVFYDDMQYPDFKKYGIKMGAGQMSRFPRHTLTNRALLPPEEEVMSDEEASERPRGTRHGVTFMTESGGGSDGELDYGEYSSDRPTRERTDIPSTSHTTDYGSSGVDAWGNEYDDEDSGSLSGDQKSRKGTEYSSGSGVTSEKRRKLYTAPPAFRLKQSDRRGTIAKDPFSTDREYNIPTGDGINIQKSDKPPTAFDEFEFGQGKWDEPDKFEFQDRAKTVPETKTREKQDLPDRAKTDIDIKKPVKTKKQQTQKPRAKSPDSGLESGTTEPPAASVSSRKKSVTISDHVSVASVEIDVMSRASSSPVPRERQKSPTPPPQREQTPERTVEVIPEEPEEEQPADDVTEDVQPAKREKRERKTRAPVVKKERKQREPPVKKTRQEKTPVTSETPLPVKEKTPTPEPEPSDHESEDEGPKLVIPDMPEFVDHDLPTPPPMRRIAPPPLPRAAPPIPPIPKDYSDLDMPKREVSQTMIEAPPPMYEPPKQRRPPPIRRPKATVRDRKPRVTRTADAGPEKTDPRDFADPLDYLAKYCIIHKDRLPYYERIFNKVVSQQGYRYSEVPHAEDAVAKEDGGTKLVTQQPLKVKLETEEERLIEHGLTVNKSTTEEYSQVGYNIGDQNVQKIHFTLDTLIDKYEDLQEKHDQLQAERLQLMADMARANFPEILKANYKKKEKKKKSKKKAAADLFPGDMLAGKKDSSAQTDDEQEAKPKTRAELTDTDILHRCTSKMLAQISEDPTLTKLNAEIVRMQEKLRDVDDRIEDLEDEKKLLQLYSRDTYRKDIDRKAKPGEFLRQQSALYQKMHQEKDAEMNLAEMEEALQMINGHLMSEKELQFIYHVLDLPGRRRINLQLFSVVAALSEKVKQLDPFVKKLINKFNYEALNVKMNRSKELFWLLDEQDEGVPSGQITSSSLELELAAGGVSPEHTYYVVNKFNRENKGSVDFMEYLTYVPLFVELHSRIIDDPLSSQRVF